MFSMLTAGQTPAPLPFLSPVFGDHMVMQRDRPNTFWGWAAPGTSVRVTIGGHSGAGVADAAGKWSARVSPPAVGGPYKVEIDGSQHVELNDVLVGDVWVCSGQSNMEMGIGLVNNAAAEIAAANHPDIRLYTVPHATSYDPIPVNGGTWAQCSPATVSAGGWSGFSAVAYFFGRELNQRLKVPIGLVHTSWGGTIAEAWTSREALIPMKDFDGGLAQIDAAKNAKVTPYAQLVDEWFAKNDPGTSANWQSADFDDSSWKTAGAKTDFDSIGLGKFDGLVWYRREIEIPEGTKTDGATLSLGKIDDIDYTWVNGRSVGSIANWAADRNYAIPAGVLHPGKNVIAVRVMDTGGGGGLYSPASDLFLKLADGSQIPLGENWRYNVAGELAKFAQFPQDVSNNPNVPTVLYNGMIAPLVPLAIKGAIWYQGESNADRGKQYQRLLPTMIGDWRKRFGQGDFPFLIVQLANFMDPPKEPSDEAWAYLREAQTMTADHVRNAGLAVTIDIGDQVDIHPKNKQEVGLRLALQALRVAYGQNVVASGPTFRSVKSEGDAIRVTFNHTDGGLVAKGGKVEGFAIAGADGKFHWATGEIIGNSVLLRSPQVPQPVAVRYAWASNPSATLYNGSGLPAVPFRSDK
ncbi:sialate O-acetylesterase [Fimbriimonas ginsengisoli]|nr:sialate O-acetylesterase [Fimbriimonas ginsengisoli]